MTTGMSLEAAPDAALRLRAFADLRPKKRFKDNQLSTGNELVEVKLPAPLTSAVPRRQRLKRSGRAQMRWRISPEICQPPAKLPLAPMLHEFLGIFTHASAASEHADNRQELNQTGKWKIFQSLFSAH
jgi:hypothetical protein